MDFNEFMDQLIANHQAKQERTFIALHEASKEKVEETKADLHYLLRYKGEPLFQSHWLDLLRAHVKLTDQVRMRALFMTQCEETKEHAEKAVLEIDKIVDALRALSRLTVGI